MSQAETRIHIFVTLVEITHIAGSVAIKTKKQIFTNVNNVIQEVINKNAATRKRELTKHKTKKLIVKL
jgi:hypothetical protein